MRKYDGRPFCPGLGMRNDSSRTRRLAVVEIYKEFNTSFYIPSFAQPYSRFTYIALCCVHLVISLQQEVLATVSRTLSRDFLPWLSKMYRLSDRSHVATRSHAGS